MGPTAVWMGWLRGVGEYGSASAGNNPLTKPTRQPTKSPLILRVLVTSFIVGGRANMGMGGGECRPWHRIGGRDRALGRLLGGFWVAWTLSRNEGGWLAARTRQQKAE